MHKAIVVVIIFCFAYLCFSAVKDRGPTYDETAHLPAGLSYLKTGDFRLNSAHPPLAKLIAALPLLFADVSIPDGSPAWDSARDFDFGTEFFRSEIPDSKNHLLLASRMMMILLGCLLCLAVYFLSLSLYGQKSAIFAALMTGFSPTIIAHSGLVNTDVCVALFCVLTFIGIDRVRRNSRITDELFLGGALGLALASKYSALLMLPFVGIFLLSRGGKGRWMTSFRVGIVTTTVLFSTYFFMDFHTYWEGLLWQASRLTSETEVYFWGEFYRGGTWLYFPGIAFIKTPVPLIICGILCLGLLTKNLREFPQRNDIWIIGFIAAFWLVSMAVDINLGIRHMLPVWPLMIVCSSWIFSHPTAGKLPGKIVSAALMAWLVVDTSLASPNFLSYFNRLTVGPENGSVATIDSNIDWGQDLKALVKYAEDKGLDSMRVNFFGTDSCDRYQENLCRPLSCEPTTGLLAVSINHYRGLTEEQSKCYRWLDPHEPLHRVGNSILVWDISED